MLHLENFAEYNKEEILKKFADLKASGEKFTLADVVRDKEGRLTKVNTTSDLVVEEPSEIPEIVQKYHDYARSINKTSLSDISQIETSVGVHYGFNYGGNLIFFEDDVMLIQDVDDPDNIHEIAIYELEEL
jgi:hypothetical protein